MTKQEFIEKRTAAIRQARIIAGPAFALYLALMMGGFWLCVYVTPQSASKNYRLLLMAIVVFPPLIAFAMLFRWINERRVRRFGLLCPDCRKPLTEMAGQIAVATGHCGECGASVFQDGSTHSR